MRGGRGVSKIHNEGEGFGFEGQNSSLVKKFFISFPPLKNFWQHEMKCSVGSAVNLGPNRRTAEDKESKLQVIDFYLF